MSGKKEVRPAEIGEMDQVFELSDRCFIRERGGMEARWGHCYRESCLNNVVLVDNRVVSHIGLVPQIMIAEDDRIQCWGISGVSTYREHRGRGYMTELMELCIRQMEEHNAAVADLGGDRQRYGHFGFERAGIKIGFDINERSIESGTSRLALSRDYVQLFSGQEGLLDTIIRIHQNERAGLERDRDQYGFFMNRRGNTVLVHTGEGEEAYIVFRSDQRKRLISEFGGSVRAVPFLIDTLLREWDNTGAEVICPMAHPCVPGLKDMSSNWYFRNARMIRIVSLERTLKSYNNTLNKHYAEQAAEGREQVSLCIEGEPAVRIECSSEGVSVKTCADKPDIELSRTGMVDLLFNPPSFLPDIHAKYPILKKLFPLDVFIWPLETV